MLCTFVSYWVSQNFASSWLKAQRSIFATSKLRKVMHSGCMDCLAGLVNCRLGQSANYLQFTREWVKKVNCERLFCDFHVVFHYMETVLNLCLQSYHCLFLDHQLVFVLFIDICTALHTLLPLIKIWQEITLKGYYNNTEGNDATHVHTTNLHANDSCKINTCCETWITVFQIEAKVWFPLPFYFCTAPYIHAVKKYICQKFRRNVLFCVACHFLLGTQHQRLKYSSSVCACTKTVRV